MADIWSRTAYRFVAIAMLALGTVVSADSVFASKAHNSVAERGLDLLNEVISQVHARYVDEPGDKKLIEGAINGMLAALDPHSSYMDEEQYSKMSREMSGEFGGVGLEIEAGRGGIRIVRVIDGTPAAQSDLKPDDIVVKIDGETSEGMAIEKAVDLMHGTPGSKVTLAVTRKGVDAPISVTLRRDVIRVNPVQQRAEGYVGYIRVTSFNGQTAEKLADAITATRKSIGPNLKGYVLDLRNNPGGLLDQAIAVSGEVLTKGVIVSIKGRTRSDSETFSADSGDLAQSKPIVVLINGGPRVLPRSLPALCRTTSAQSLSARARTERGPCRRLCRSTGEAPCVLPRPATLRRPGGQFRPEASIPMSSSKRRFPKT